MISPGQHYQALSAGYNYAIGEPSRCRTELMRSYEVILGRIDDAYSHTFGPDFLGISDYNAAVCF